MCKINLKKIERQTSEAPKAFQPYPYPVHNLDLNNVSGMPSLEELNAKLLATSTPSFYSGSPFEEPYLSADGFSLIDLGSSSNPFLASLEDLEAMSSFPISTESASYYPMMSAAAASSSFQPQPQLQLQLQSQFTSFPMDIPYHTLPPTSPEQAALSSPSPLSSSPILESEKVLSMPLDHIKMNSFSSCGEEEEEEDEGGEEEEEEERSCSPSPVVSSSTSPTGMKGLASSLGPNPVTFHQVNVTSNKKKTGITQSTTVDKRERNRLAAEKYRKKGREMISTLEKKCQELIKENGNLLNRNKGLEEEIAYLHQVLSKSGAVSRMAGSQTSSALVY